MLLGPLEDLRTEPGTVLAVVPSADCLAAAAEAPADDVPPSFLQADHLRGYAELKRRGGRHRAWTGVATEIDGPLDRAALCRALTRLVATHEGLRTWFDVTGEEPVRHLVPASAVEHVIARETVIPADEAWHAGLRAHLLERFDAECRPDTWPGFSLAVVERAQSFAVVWGCDHAFTDGASQIMLASELSDTYAAEAARPGGPEQVPDALPGPDEAGGFGEYAAAERGRAATFGATSPEVADWVRLVTDNGGRLPSFPLDLGLGPGETDPVRITTIPLLDAAGVARLEHRCRAAGVRLAAGLFAAIGATEHVLAERDRYAGVTVLSTRGTGPYGRSQGWFCAFAPIAFDVAAHGRVDDLLRAAHDALARGKQVAGMPVHVALAEMIRSGVMDPGAVGSPQLVSYIDLRWFPGAGRPAHERGLHFTGSGRTANASMWVNRDQERLYAVVQGPDNPVAQASIQRYHATLAATIDAFADGGEDVVPRDVAHAGHDR